MFFEPPPARKPEISPPRSGESSFVGTSADRREEAKATIVGGTPAITRETRVLHQLATLAGSTPGMIFMHMATDYHGEKKGGVL